MRILAVANQKGGSGKSTVAGNLARVLSRRRAVQLVDADPQGSLATWLGDAVVRAANPVSLERVLSTARKELVIIDCPPHDPRATALAVERARLVIVPVVPSPFDVRSAAPLLRGLADNRKRALVVLNGLRARTRAAEAARAALRQLGVPLARATLGHRTAFVQAVAAGLPVTDFAPRSKAAEEIEALGREVARHLGR